MGQIEGMSTITDVNHDEVYEFIGRTITDGAYLSTTDKTYFNYSIINGKYEITGLINLSDFAIIKRYLLDYFRLFPTLFPFNDYFLFLLVHSESLNDCVDWFYNNKHIIQTNEENHIALDSMEKEFIVPIKNMQKGISNPTTWNIYKSRIVDDDYLESLTNSELRLLRNYFFSINGYKFNSSDLVKYFKEYDCYDPSDSFQKSDLNYIETYNINKIQKYEN